MLAALRPYDHVLAFQLNRCDHASATLAVARVVTAAGDAAAARGAGVHVRFRLGGACFPPLLLYRIFTHRPVADVGAFAPRDYSTDAAARRGDRGSSAAAALDTSAPTSASARARAEAREDAAFDLPDSVRRFVRRDGRVGLRARRGWYRRQDNNGWRAVDEVRMALGDSLGGTSRAQLMRAAGAPYHPSPTVRREEREQRRKRRRREWLLALYKCELDPCDLEGIALATACGAQRSAHATEALSSLKLCIGCARAGQTCVVLRALASLPART